MTTIKRFTPDYKMHAARFEPFARETEHGELVKLSDYEALVSELASSRQINAQTLQVKLTMAETIKELTDRVNGLTVENESLFSAAGEVYAAGYNHGHLNTVDGIAYTEGVEESFASSGAQVLFESSETPATDAAVREIEARGVEKFAEFLDSPIDGQHCYQNEVGLARHFASTLREAK
ncbi:hypothetical protein IBZ16_05270 [Serratia marcescens]|uniref:hypothetical protein n=1 Tax=Serratia marcescens TaxID=615 RepID=UPI0039B3AAAF